MLQRHRRCSAIVRRIRYVRRFFPELDGLSLRVGLTRAASGMAVMGGTEIWFNPSQTSYHTIAHELVHLLQTRDCGVPQGERSCDVFSLARHWTLNDVPPSYVKTPASFISENGGISEAGAHLLFDAANEAVARRAAGMRNYIQFFERRLQDIVTGLSGPF